MTEVFADTSGWACYFLHSQTFHELAQKLLWRWRDRGARVVTTNYVLTELAALLTRPLRVPHEQKVQIIEAIQKAEWVEVAHIDPATDEQAWALWKRRSDKEWSLVDCASFVVMRRRAIVEALATDYHFEQSGYQRLLK